VERRGEEEERRGREEESENVKIEIFVKSSIFSKKKK